MSDVDYGAFVDALANEIVGRPEDPRSVANMCVVASTNRGGDKLLYLSLIDDHITEETGKERLWPKDVLLGSDAYPFDADQPDGLRELAVDVLTADLHRAIDERMDARAEIAAEKRLDERRERYLDSPRTR